MVNRGGFMKVLTLGSLNFDFVYTVSHINLEGETISAREMEQKHGGKGLNQSVALARAGAQVTMAGCIGTDGEPLVETLRMSGVDTSQIRTVDGRSGHAIIQLADSGANAIVIYGGANEQITPMMIDETLSYFDAGDYILMQNEISCVGYAISAAKKKGMKVAFNPSPVSEQLAGYPLALVDILILNELEGQSLSGAAPHSSSDDILAVLANRFPEAAIVLTLGADGVMYHDAEQDLQCPACRVSVVDTTGAGDTFCGYFLACVIKGMDPAHALETATAASALAIGKKGAAVSIPTLAEVLKQTCIDA